MKNEDAHSLTKQDDFPHTSSKGNKYIMIWYHYDINTIITESMKNRTEGEINRAFKKVHDKLTTQGYDPKVHMIDNKCSTSLKEIMENDKLD